jgi:hypothetical protein
MGLEIKILAEKAVREGLKKEELVLVDPAHEWLAANGKGKSFKDYAEIMEWLKEARAFLRQKGLGPEHSILLTPTPGKHDHIELTLGEKTSERRVVILADVVEVKEAKKAAGKKA